MAATTMVPRSSLFRVSYFLYLLILPVVSSQASSLWVSPVSHDLLFQSAGEEENHGLNIRHQQNEYLVLQPQDARFLVQQPISNPRVPSQRTPSSTMESGSIASMHFFVDGTTLAGANNANTPSIIQERVSGGGGSGLKKGGKVMIWFTVFLGLGLAFFGYRRYSRKRRFQRANQLQSYDDVYDNIHNIGGADGVGRFSENTSRFTEVSMVPVRTSSNQAPLRNSTYV